MELFEIQDVPIKNFRLRTYDPKLKARMAVHAHFDMQLHKLNFHSHMDLLIETKSDDDEFEEYDTNWLFIRVVKHVEGEPYDFK